MALTPSCRKTNSSIYTDMWRIATPAFNRTVAAIERLVPINMRVSHTTSATLSCARKSELRGENSITVWIGTLWLESRFRLSHRLIRIFFLILLLTRSRGSSVGVETSYGLDNRGVGVESRWGQEFFSFPNRPDRLWGPLNLLSNGYRGLFPRG
jgi:hypothetical protein